MTRSGFLRLQAVAWTAYAALHVVATLPAVQPGRVRDLIALKVIRAVGGFIVTTPLLPLWDRVLGARGRPAVVAARAGALAFTLGNVWLVLDRVLLALARGLFPIDVDWRLFPRGFDLDYTLALLVWSAAYVAFWHWRESARRERELLEARIVARDSQLEALRLQLNPHFLFNTLNSLRGLIAEDRDRAREMVTRLAAFLRQSVAAAPAARLDDEIALVRTYLDIEALRFEGPVDATIDIDPGAGRRLVPPLVLQPALENALKYGLPDAAGVRRIRISAKIEAGGLRIEVANPGRLRLNLAPGLGLSNIRARIAQFSDGAAALTLDERDGWVSLLIVMPAFEG
jgi:hypothetical protein